jgi:anti-sigma-K factor RskA
MSAAERDLDELLGAYALDAVDPTERRLVEEYIRVDPRARQEVEEHREVATMLAWTSMSAPEGLWERIAAGLDEPAPKPGEQLASVMSMGEARQRRSRVQQVGLWAIGAAAAAIVAIVVVQLVAGPAASPTLAAMMDTAKSDRRSVTAQLVTSDGSPAAEAVIDSDGHGFLAASSLPVLPPNKTYQLWGVIGDNVISLGVLGSNPEISMFSAGAPISTLVVTIEEAGGVVSNGNPDGAYVGAVG